MINSAMIQPTDQISTFSSYRSQLMNTSGALHQLKQTDRSIFQTSSHQQSLTEWRHNPSADHSWPHALTRNRESRRIFTSLEREKIAFNSLLGPNSDWFRYLWVLNPREENERRAWSFGRSFLPDEWHRLNEWTSIHGEANRSVVWYDLLKMVCHVWSLCSGRNRRNSKRNTYENRFLIETETDSRLTMFESHWHLSRE